MPPARPREPDADSATTRPRLRRVIKTLRPGTPGTQRLVYRYGDRLVCVRYREDAAGTTRYTTVELIVDHGPLLHRAHRDTRVAVEIPFARRHLCRRALELGAEWDEEQRIWWMSWQTAQALGLDAQAQTRRPRRRAALE